MNNHQHFFYVDAKAGAGKTFHALNWAVKCAHFNNQKSVILTKTTQLMEQAYEDACGFRAMLGNSNIGITSINSDNYHLVSAKNTNTRSAILEHVQNADYSVGEVLLITEAAYLLMPYWPKRWKWHLICDEIPSVVDAHVMNVPDHHRMITEHLRLEPSKPGHSLVLPTDDLSVLKSYAVNRKRDEISAYFGEVAQKVLSDHYDVYTLTDSYMRVKNNDSLNGVFQLHFFSLLKPTIFGTGEDFTDQFDGPINAFASVTIMGACFKDSMLYYLWPDMGVEFSAHPKIGKKLQYQKHTCGDRLSIKYVFERNWSKRLRNSKSQVGGSQVSNIDIYLDAIKHEFAGSDFIYMVNNDIADEVAKPMSAIMGHKISNNPYGLNCYQHIHQAVVLSALNPTNAHFRFLSEMGIDADAVREGLYFQSCYQAIMRTSLRDKNSTEPVTVIVSDRAAAHALRELFDGASVSSIQTGIEEPEVRRIGRPPADMKKSGADTNRETKARNRRINQLIAQLQNGTYLDFSAIDEETTHISKYCRSDNKAIGQLKLLIERHYSCPLSQRDITQNNNQFNASIFASIFSSKPDAHLCLDITDVDAFMDQLRQTAQSPVNSKTQNCLISTTEFDASMSAQTNRGLDNIKRIWGIWLDVDGGDMPASQLPKIFPDMRMAVFNSNSLGNYRAFIPTKDYLSIDEYAGITKLIVGQIEQHTTDAEHEAARYQNRRPFTYVSHQKAKKLKQQYGQVRPVHGIDLTKLTPNSMFYLPSLCGDDPSASFFIDYNDEHRHILDHRQWLETNPADIEDIEHSYLEFERSQPKPQKQTTPNLGVDAPSINPDEIIEKALQEYTAVADGTGRHHAFFKAAWKIHNLANVPLSELKQHLTLCDYDGHQSKNYDGIIKQLATPKYQLNHKH